MTSLLRHSLWATLPFALLVACSDRSSPPASAPTGAPPASTSSSSSTSATSTTKQEPVVPPNTATDVEKKKGSETGMIGGESGTVASSGKQGTGTAEGGGTGPAESSGTRTENMK